MNQNFGGNDGGERSKSCSYHVRQHFVDTLHWYSLTGDQNSEFTRSNLDYDGSQTAVIASAKQATVNTGHTLADGDAFDLAYVTLPDPCQVARCDTGIPEDQPTSRGWHHGLSARGRIQSRRNFYSDSSGFRHEKRKLRFWRTSWIYRQRSLDYVRGHGVS